MSQDVMYIPPDEIATRLLNLCIVTLTEAITTRTDKEALISPEQVRWNLPGGSGWINFYRSGYILIQSSTCGDLQYEDATAPKEIQTLIQIARRHLAEWNQVRVAVKFSALF